MSEGLEYAEHEARFWENRYRVQHKMVHKLEDALAAERQHRERLQEALKELVEQACGTCQPDADSLGDGMCFGCFARAALSEKEAE